MRSKFKWIFTLLVALTMQFSFAQEKTVTGVVSDKTGPLPGANVIVKGTKRSAQTDFDGKYSIKAKSGEVLEFSFTGYTKSTVSVGAANSYNVVLKESSVVLEDVVISGYDRKATKSKSMASSVTVTSETFENRPNVSFLQSLQGAAAGVQVSTSSGSPGSAKVDILVRGLGTLSGDTQPLYVIDGIQSSSNVFRGLNPDDIESATLLKDAIATSIYGTSGTNGVIVITTKAGKFNSGLKVSYSTSTGYSMYNNDSYNLADSKTALLLERQVGYGVGHGDTTPFFVGGTPLTDSQIASYKTTDWRKEFFKTGITNNHNLSFSMGGKNLSNFTSLSYTNQSGIVPTTDFQRFTLRTNFNGKSDNEKFVYGSTFTVAYSKRHQLDQETREGSSSINNNVVQNPLLGSLTALPYLSPDMYPGSGQGLYDAIGSDFTHGNTTFVLKDVLTDGNLPNLIGELKIQGNVNGSYKITPDLTATTKIGVENTQSNRTFARAPWSYLAVVVRENNAVPYGGLETRTSFNDFQFNIINSLNYKKTFKEKHVIELGAYQEYRKLNYNSSAFRQNGLDLNTYAFNSGTGWTNVGSSYPSLRPSVSGTNANAGSFAYFGTASYEYNDRYAIEGLVRRDANYRFTDDYKWGTFWSLGVRWNIDKESFMKDTWFNRLKFRASIGTQGNGNVISGYAGTNNFYLGNTLIRDLIGTTAGYNNAGAYGVTQIANTTARWENQQLTNIGLDFEMFKGRFSGNLDVYNKQTTDLYNNINISAVVGNGTTYPGNNGGINNKGIELALRYKIIKDSKDFKLSVYANGSYNQNKITDIQKTISGDRILENGSLVYEYYYVPYVGVNPANGNLLFLDINNNLTESPADKDRRKTGKSEIPKYQGAFGFNTDYKGFYVDSQFTFVKDVWINDTALSWLYNPSYIGDNNVSADLLNAWTPTNTNTNIPSLFATNYSSALDYSDKFLKDASYIRLKNIQIGYTFNKNQLKGTFFKAVKLYAQGENLCTWSKWRGFDPESTNSSNIGGFPSPRIISFGLNVEF